jgi:hypothetical protein
MRTGCGTLPVRHTPHHKASRPICGSSLCEVTEKGLSAGPVTGESLILSTPYREKSCDRTRTGGLN